MTILQLVPSLLRLLMSERGLDESRTLRRVLCGGEELTSSLVEEFNRRVEAQLINLYGPTEAAIDTIWWEVERGREEGPVPIGRPVSNTQVYILDGHLQPVPIGVPGELYIGGKSLARGYINRPELTAERFVPNPFSTEPGERLYRTGDLCRYLTDGNIVFLERIDNQVKVRGNRIELGEIEEALNTHPQVREAVVVVRETQRGEKRLVGHVVAAAGVEVNSSEIRAHLKQRLPDYMIPSGYVFRERIPLSSNGKIDRRALIEEEQSGLEATRIYEGPRTYIEEELVAIWKEILGIERVGISDNFFEIGGHSLMAAQIISRVRKVFGVEIPLRGLFEEPTIEHLAMEIVKTQTETLDSEEVARILADLEEISDAEV